MASVWIVYTELRPRPGCQLPPDAGGAFVECYVPTLLIENAIRFAREALEEDDYEVIDVSQVVRFDPDQWDEDNDPDAEVRSLVKEAEILQAIVYGPFRYWPKDAPDDLDSSDWDDFFIGYA